MTAPLMPKATAVWLVENTTLTFVQIADFCELHELEVQAIADGDVAFNIMGISPIDTNQLSWDEIHRCEADRAARLEANKLELNVREKNAKAKKMLSPSQRSDKPNAVAWILKNCPEITDSQICKLIGTTKPTIKSIREGTHKDSANIRAKNPVAIGLCSEKELEAAINAVRLKAAAAAEKKAAAKAKKKAKKEAVKKKAKEKQKQELAKEKRKSRKTQKAKPAQTAEEN